ncbi:hypothetical protein FHG87_017237 [Trinorchestia longiramus]|nr:hypothetical protein FHG87_017237 [Trinorchestia longiramus]
MIHHTVAETSVKYQHSEHMTGISTSSQTATASNTASIVYLDAVTAVAKACSTKNISCSINNSTSCSNNSRTSCSNNNSIIPAAVSTTVPAASKVPAAATVPAAASTQLTHSHTAHAQPHSTARLSRSKTGFQMPVSGNTTAFTRLVVAAKRGNSIEEKEELQQREENTRAKKRRKHCSKEKTILQRREGNTAAKRRKHCWGRRRRGRKELDLPCYPVPTSMLLNRKLRADAKKLANTQLIEGQGAMSIKLLCDGKGGGHGPSKVEAHWPTQPWKIGRQLQTLLGCISNALI